MPTLKSTVVLGVLVFGLGCSRSPLALPPVAENAEPAPSRPATGSGGMGSIDPCERDGDCDPPSSGTRFDSGVTVPEPGVTLPDSSVTDLDSGIEDSDAGTTCEERAQALGLRHATTSLESLFVVASHPQGAQTVTPSATVSIRAVVLPLYTCKQNYFVDAQVRIVATLPDGQPDVSRVLATSEVVPNSQLPIGCVTGEDRFAEIELRFGAPVTLDADTLYAVVLAGVGPEADGELFWRHSAPPQPGEQAYRRGRPWQFSRRPIPGHWDPILDQADLAFMFVLAECE